MDGSCAGGTHQRRRNLVRSVVSKFSGSVLLLVTGLPLASHAGAQVRPIELEGFIISGTPVPRTAGTESSHVTVLDGEELRGRGLTRVADALTEVPGLVVIRGGSYGGLTSTFFRGAESDHTKVLVDGVEMNQSGGSFDFSGLLLSDVERIEVVRGPASAFYGSDAMAGVIHIITRKGSGPPEGTVSLGGGSYGRVSLGADVHGGTENSGYSLSLARERAEGILAFNNQFSNTVLSGKAFLRPDEKTRVQVSGRYADRTYHFPTDGTGNVVDRNAFTFGDELGLGAEVGRVFSESLEIVANLKTYRWEGGSDDRSDGPADTLGYFGYVSADVFQRRVGDVRMNLSPRRGSVASVGFELEQETQASKSESLSQWGTFPDQAEFERWNRGYYAHVVAEGHEWAGNVGVRLDDNEEYGRFVTYQAGISYAIPKTRSRIRASLGKGLKEPTFLETSSSGFSVGNPDLEPEASRVWEMGVEQALGDEGVEVSITWFHQNLENLIQYTFMPPDPAGPNYFNVAEARTRGLEATASIPLGRLNLSGAYTYMDSEVLDSGFDDGPGAVFVEGEALIRRPKHQTALTATYQLPRVVVSGGVHWTGSRTDRDFSDVPASPVELSSYTLVEFGANLDLIRPRGGRPGMEFQVKGENLLDERYEGIFGFAGPGRAFLVGVRMRFGAGPN